MKIAMIDPSLFTWPYDKALIDGLRNQGCEVLFFTKFLAVGEQGKDADGLCEFFYPGFQYNWVKKLPHPLFLAFKGLFHIFSLIALWLTLKNQKPDLIHFQWVPLPIVDSFFIPFFKKIAPVVLTVHDSSPFNNNPKSKLQGFGAIDIMRLFDHMIVHTETTKKTVHNYGIPMNRISQIAHGVIGMDKISMIKNIKPPKMENDKVVVLLFGHLKPYKGADILIESLAHLSLKAKHKILVRIVGKPQMDVEPLFSRAKELDVQDQIQWDLRFIGDDEIDDVFQSSDITVMPYREIDASGVLMLALSIGRPIVASKIGLFAEILKDGEHGYLVDQENSIQLAKALNDLVLDKTLRDEMGKNVIELGQSIPSWDDIALKTMNLYQSLKA